MWQNKRISIVFPVYNEEKNIRKAINEFFKTGVVDEVIAVDNNSKDKSAKEIKRTKAIYILETIQGYGSALQRGLKEARGDLIFTCEPDGTFEAKDIFKFLAYSNDFDVVLGTRTSKELIWKEANMGWFLRLGNEFVAKLMEYLFNGPSITDVGCTFKLIKKEALKKIIPYFTVNGSHFSPEFMLLSITKGLRVVEIPINYKGRIGESKITGSYKKAFKLGLIMIYLILSCRLRLWIIQLSNYLSTKKSGYHFLLAAIICLFLLLVFPLLPARGHDSDLRDFANWAKSTTELGIQNIYSGDNLATRSIYPPVILYLFNIVGFVYKIFFSLEFNIVTGIITSFIKLPILIFHLLISYIMYSYFAKRSRLWGILTAVLFLFNPAVIYSQYFWGEPDTIHTFFILTTVLGFATHNFASAGISYTLATLSKPQAWVMLPFVILISMLNGRKAFLKVVLWGFLTFLIVSLPFILYGKMFDYLLMFMTAFGVMPFLTAGAANLWAFLQLGSYEYIPDSNILFGHVTFYTAGLIALLSSYTLVGFKLIKNYKNEKILFLLASYITFSFFLLPTRIHSNHIFFSLPLFLMASFHFRWMINIYLAATVAFTINLLFQDAWLRMFSAAIYLCGFIYFTKKIILLEGNSKLILNILRRKKLPVMFYMITGFVTLVLGILLSFKGAILEFGLSIITMILASWQSAMGMDFYMNLLNRMLDQFLLLLSLLAGILLSITAFNWYSRKILKTK